MRDNDSLDGNIAKDGSAVDNESETVVVLQRKLHSVTLRIVQLQHRHFVATRQRNVAHHMHRALRRCVRTLWNDAVRHEIKHFIPRHVIKDFMRRHSLYLSEIERHRKQFLAGELS